MRLKSFHAETMSEAMSLVRQSLGEDAVIVSTREDEAGGVRVTAAVDEDHGPGGDWSRPAPAASAPAASAPARERHQAATAPVSGPRPTPAQDSSVGDYDDYDAFGDDACNTFGDDAGEAGPVFGRATALTETADAPDTAPEDTEIGERLADALWRHGVPAEVTEELIAAATATRASNIMEALEVALSAVFGFAPLPPGRDATPVMLVGQPGAGKTLNIAKLATRAVMNGYHPLVITTDVARAGGIDQLQSFTDLLKTELITCADAACLGDCVARAREAGPPDQILIDTSGVNPFEREEMRTLDRLARAAGAEPVLVMPAGLDPWESGEIAEAFATIGVTRLMPTRLDSARRIGGLLAAAARGNMAFGDAGDTAKVADGLVAMAAHQMAQLVLPGHHPAGNDDRTGDSHRCEAGLETTATGQRKRA